MSDKVVHEWEGESYKFRIRPYYKHFKLEYFHGESKTWQSQTRPYLLVEQTQELALLAERVKELEAENKALKKRDDNNFANSKSCPKSWGY